MSNLSEHHQYLNAIFPDFEPGLKARLAESCSIQKFKAGELIMRTGQYIKHSILIFEGRIKIYREDKEGSEVFMYYLEPGNACALSMICATRQKTSQVMAKALEDTTTLIIPVQLMDDLMRTYKTWYEFVLDTWRSRFEELLIVLDHIVFKGMDQRLEFYLKNQHKKLNTRMLPVTHQEIAGDLNTSREVVSRLLKKMELNGMVRLHRSYIEWLE